MVNVILNINYCFYYMVIILVYKWKIKIDRWGGLLAFLCWLPIFGDPIAIALGFFRTNPYTVVIFMFLGKLVRYFIWALFTYWGISLF